MKKYCLAFVSAIVPLLLCSQQTIHVPGDYQSIQDAINASNHGDVVLVDEGTYVENIYFNGKKITVASKLYEDGDETHIEKTILDGSSGTGDYQSVVHFTSGEDTTSTLMGFTIINGSGYQDRMGGGILVNKSGARIVSNRIIGCKLVSSQSFGAGICASSSEDGNNYFIIIENNLIEGDSAFSSEGNGAFGGGIYIQTMNARIRGNVIKRCLTNGGEYCVGGGIAVYGYVKQHVVQIMENEIYSNKCDGAKNIGGGIFVYNCTPVIVDNHIYSNVVQGEEHIFSFAKGGGIAAERVNEGSVISGNLIEKNKCKNKQWPNWGGGLEVYCPDTVPESLNNVYIDGNTFRKNEAYWGGGASVWRSSASFTNNYFDDNYAKEYGGAIHVTRLLDDSKTVRIINNTFYSNASVLNGASIYSNLDGNLLLMNNIHWKNLGADEITGGPAKLEIHYCNVDVDSINAEWEGSQNFRKDPMLESGCELNANSPCVDRGTGNVQAFGKTFYAPFHDVRRVLRPQGGNYDVGSYELIVAIEDTLDFGDLMRLYKVYLPQGYYRGDEFPIVINLHGADRNAQYQMDWTGMNSLADEMDFIAVYPDAVDGMWNTDLKEYVDDIGFIQAMIDAMDDKYNVDLDRVYVCGFGLGGTMSSTLACRLSGSVAAMTCVGGEIEDNVSGGCDIQRKMPVLIMHGTDDQQVEFTKAEEQLSFWNSQNDCSLLEVETLPDLDPSDGCTVEKSTFIDEDETCEVLFYSINDGGHSWSGANWKEEGDGNMNMDINANVELWNFFKKYSLSDFPSGIDVSGDVQQMVNVYPNPFYSTVMIEYTLNTPSLVIMSIFNFTGKMIEQFNREGERGLNRITWNADHLSEGIYFYRLETDNEVFSGKILHIQK